VIHPPLKPEILVHLVLGLLVLATKASEHLLKVGVELGLAELRVSLLERLGLRVTGLVVGRPKVGADKVEGRVPQEVITALAGEALPVELELTDDPEDPTDALELVAVRLRQAPKGGGVDLKEHQDLWVEVLRSQSILAGLAFGERRGGVQIQVLEKLRQRLQLCDEAIVVVVLARWVLARRHQVLRGHRLANLAR